MVKLAELGEPIARGGVSELYALPNGRVLKLFNRGWDARFAASEARITARLHSLGLRVPAVGEPIEVEERFGFPMERLDGEILAKRALADPASAVFIERFEKEYFALLPEGREEFERAKPVVAAVRLALPHPPTSDETLRRIVQGSAASAAS